VNENSESLTSGAAGLRKEYRRSTLLEAQVSENPFAQFTKWLDEAVKSQIVEPNAMVLSTASPHGAPSSRVVLLKEWTEKGFVFYSNYKSQKAKQLKVNPAASLLFYWPDLERQIRIEGAITKVSRVESEKYFIRRPRNAQLGAYASEQSAVLPERSLLEKQYKEFESRFHGQEVPCPSHWGGYLLIPKLYEFWQGRENRLHDRILYTKESKKNWELSRLSP